MKFQRKKQDPNRPTKYNSHKVNYEGMVFDSKREFNHWLFLKELEADGKITDLQRQVKFVLVPSQKDSKGKCIEREVYYKADFVFKDSNGKTVVQDSKGMRPTEYIIKRKLMLYVHGIRIEEV